MIEQTELRPDSLVVTWSDGTRSSYPWRWVRDHSHDPDTLHPVTHQRQIAADDLDPDLRPDEVTVEPDHVEVTWANAVPASILPIELLFGLREPTVAGSHRPTADAVHWDAATLADDWPAIECDRVMATDEGVREWLDLVGVYGFAIVTGTPATPQATEALVRRVGYVRETIFGGMWDFQPDLAMADTAYTSVELPPHTDGTYSHDAPGLQILHVLAFDGDGGESVLVDGFRIADELCATEPELYDVLATVEVPGQYVGDGAHLMAARPVFRHDSSGALVQVSFNNADRAPFLLPGDEMDRFHDALRAFEAIAHDRRLQWRRANPPGDAMLFDNWRVLHGRTEFTGHRHLCGGYVNREDYESRRRVLARA